MTTRIAMAALASTADGERLRRDDRLPAAAPLPLHPPSPALRAMNASSKGDPLTKRKRPRGKNPRTDAFLEALEQRISEN